MRKLFKPENLHVLALVISLGVIGWSVLNAISVANAAPESNRKVAGMTRVCIPVSGHSTKLSLSGTSAATGELDESTVYEIVCDVAVYWELGDGSAPTADSNGQLLPANTPRYFGTSQRNGRSDYVAALDVATDGTCWIRACR